jgi:hypothetical protein
MQQVIPPHPKLLGRYDWLAHINWGHGMIGKATVAVVVLLALLGIIGARVPSEMAMLLVGGGGIFSVFVYLVFLTYFARNHPEIAATEGATYVQSRQLELAAKNLPKHIDAEIVPDPQNPTLLSPNLSPKGSK